MYPPLARQARVQGTVRFTVVINPDGTVKSIELVSGHPLLVQPAMDAVRQYKYAPASGEQTTLADVNFVATS